MGKMAETPGSPKTDRLVIRVLGTGAHEELLIDAEGIEALRLSETGQARLQVLALEAAIEVWGQGDRPKEPVIRSVTLPSGRTIELVLCEAWSEP